MQHSPPALSLEPVEVECVGLNVDGSWLSNFSPLSCAQTRKKTYEFHGRVHGSRAPYDVRASLLVSLTRWHGHQRPTRIHNNTRTLHGWCDRWRSYSFGVSNCAQMWRSYPFQQDTHLEAMIDLYYLYQEWATWKVIRLSYLAHVSLIRPPNNRLSSHLRPMSRPLSDNSCSSLHNLARYYHERDSFLEWILAQASGN